MTRIDDVIYDTTFKSWTEMTPSTYYLTPSNFQLPAKATIDRCTLSSDNKCRYDIIPKLHVNIYLVEYDVQSLIVRASDASSLHTYIYTYVARHLLGRYPQLPSVPSSRDDGRMTIATQVISVVSVLII
ncbi:hypothetical protein T310_7424 [Rasamsonia emersonii CBS 393.64]|uniref:Uncharacterized protein n=1 Tax=Rasamsonia emersonii (strain ATCC 16479 / CBS 393.64 / IMI 116815) TaxID=1408163 RepID=A0A0F4YLZ3_RASE3|nr:hypothetical protein T310_7424 [Rasamsonia emersonii CBS 393.64]KKA18623.1 hypothetical protein T310_7424 [Rasamsonia emersonii CBS 393.64]